MDCYERMNAAIRYIEDNLSNEIDYAQIARIACCPAHQFQRLFAFMADMPLSDYIRRRKMTLAAQDLQESKIRILDIALKYGYDSHASFTRAFKEHHGISPAKARSQDAVIHRFPILVFHSPVPAKQNYRMEKGTIKMAKAIQCDMTPFGPYQIIGKQIRTTILSPQISALWARCFTDGTYEKLAQMKEWIPEELAEDYIGYIRDVEENGALTYVVGMFMKPGAPVPQGYFSYDIPACTIARVQVQGEEYDIYPNAHALSVEALEQRGYRVDEENFFACQVYTDERFSIPKNSGERVLIMDYYLPCKK